MRKLRVLLSAYACEPGKGSEPAVGWNVLLEVSKFHDVWVLTRRNNGDAIERYFGGTPPTNIKLVYVDLPRWASFWKRGSRGVQVYYYLWQLHAYRTALRLHRRVSFDLAHHVTFAKYWAPSFIALLNIPFVWGPVGGGESAPFAFWAALGMKGLLHEALRLLASRLAELDPFVRLTARKASVAFASTPETAKRLTMLGAKRVVVMPQVAVARAEMAECAPTDRPVVSRVRFVSVGNLLPLKAFSLALGAFAQAEMPNAEYWIVGDGMEKRRLAELVQSLGIGSVVRFLGHVPRSEALAAIRECDVLVHPSLHDSGAFVCIEAMAAGKPVICLNYGGPAQQVTDKCGVVVDARNPDEAIDGLARAMALLARDAPTRHLLGDNGRSRVEAEYTWERRGERIMKAYVEVTRNTQPS